MYLLCIGQVRRTDQILDFLPAHSPATCLAQITFYNLCIILCIVDFPSYCNLPSTGLMLKYDPKYIFTKYKYIQRAPGSLPHVFQVQRILQSWNIRYWILDICTPEYNQFGIIDKVLSSVERSWKVKYNLLFFCCHLDHGFSCFFSSFTTLRSHLPVSKLPN